MTCYEDCMCMEYVVVIERSHDMLVGKVCVKKNMYRSVHVCLMLYSERRNSSH